jgi:hypothetical protein
LPSSLHTQFPKKVLQNVVKQSSDAVVLIVISNSAEQETALGSGFLVSADGEIVTNYDVMKEARSVIVAAWSAHSPVLLAFGGDSAIELFSVVVVLWRFRARAAAHEGAESLAARVAGGLLFALAALVAITSVTNLLGYGEPKPAFSHFDLSRSHHAVARQKRSVVCQELQAVLH